jgi:hypothetical protein
MKVVASKSFRQSVPRKRFISLLHIGSA